MERMGYEAEFSYDEMNDRVVATLRELSTEEQRLLLSQAAQGDATVPLVFETGYVHEVCGGPAELGNSPHVIAYCRACDRTVPVSEVRKA